MSPYPYINPLISFRNILQIFGFGRILGEPIVRRQNKLQLFIQHFYLPLKWLSHWHLKNICSPLNLKPPPSHPNIELGSPSTNLTFTLTKRHQVWTKYLNPFESYSANRRTDGQIGIRHLRFGIPKKRPRLKYNNILSKRINLRPRNFVVCPFFFLCYILLAYLWAISVDLSFVFMFVT